MTTLISLLKNYFKPTPYLTFRTPTRVWIHLEIPFHNVGHVQLTIEPTFESFNSWPAIKEHIEGLAINLVAQKRYTSNRVAIAVELQEAWLNNNWTTNLKL